MPAQDATAREIAPQEPGAEALKSQEHVPELDRVSGEYEVAEKFVADEAAAAEQQALPLADAAANPEFPESGQRAQEIAAQTRSELAAAKQTAEQGIQRVVKGEPANETAEVDAEFSRMHAEAMAPQPEKIVPMPIKAVGEMTAPSPDVQPTAATAAPERQTDAPASPEAVEKLNAITAMEDQARSRMSEIFLELMKMKQSGGKLDAGEYETYKKMLDEDAVLNAFVQKLQAEFDDISNDPRVRERAAVLAGEFAEGARTQAAFAEQMAKHDAESSVLAKAALVAGAVGAGIATAPDRGPAGAENAGAVKKPESSGPDAPEGPQIADLRAKSAQLAEQMERAKEYGQSEVYDQNLTELIKTEKLLLAEMLALPTPSSKQQKEIERLQFHIGKLETDAELRKELAELKKLEIEKKEIEAEIVALSDGGDPEKLADAKDRLAKVVEKIKEKNEKIAVLRGNQEKLESIERAEKNLAKPVDLGEKAAEGVAAVGEGILDPGKVALKALDVLIGDKKKAG